MAGELYEKRREQMFPKLAAAQIARLETHGRRTATRAGEVLIEAGERQHKFLVVLQGSLQVALPAMRDRDVAREVITTLEPGDFTGELSTLRGAAGFTRISVREGGAVLALDVERLRELVQTDAELSEILMRAFILRRMGLVESKHADLKCGSTKPSSAPGSCSRRAARARQLF